MGFMLSSELTHFVSVGAAAIFWFCYLDSFHYNENHRSHRMVLYTRLCISIFLYSAIKYSGQAAYRLQTYGITISTERPVYVNFKYHREKL